MLLLSNVDIEWLLDMRSCLEVLETIMAAMGGDRPWQTLSFPSP